MPIPTDNAASSSQQAAPSLFDTLIEIRMAVIKLIKTEAVEAIKNDSVRNTEYSKTLQLIRNTYSKVKSDAQPSSRALAVCHYYLIELLTRCPLTYKNANEGDEKKRQYDFVTNAINLITHVLKITDPTVRSTFVNPITRYLSELPADVIAALPLPAQARLDANKKELEKYFPTKFGRYSCAYSALSYVQKGSSHALKSIQAGPDGMGFFEKRLLGAGLALGYMYPAGGLIVAGLWGITSKVVGKVIDQTLSANNIVYSQR